MADHPNAITVRDFLHAWFGGDLEAWGRLAADDIVIHMRGKPAINGHYKGREGVLEMFQKFATIPFDDMAFEIEDVFADDRFACALFNSHYERDGATLDLRNACAYKIDVSGRIAEVWNVSDNQGPEEAFFDVE